MAINPGADLLTDALAAADPQRAKAAEEKLARLATQDAEDPSAAPEFQEVLASGSSSLKIPGALSAALHDTVHPAKLGNPYQQFEVTVLKSLFELMLPAKANAVFGSGFAGEVWRSMLAEFARRGCREGRGCRNRAQSRSAKAEWKARYPVLELVMHEDAAVIRSPAISELTKAALDRLEKALDQENEALAAFDPRNLSEYSRIKTQSLLELQRSTTVLSRENAPPELMQSLTTLRQKLELNSWLLLLHLEAAREVTTVITSAMRDAESDGTYSRVSSLPKVVS